MVDLNFSVANFRICLNLENKSVVEDDCGTTTLPSFLNIGSAPKMPNVDTVLRTVIVVLPLVGTTFSCCEDRKAQQHLGFLSLTQQADLGAADAIPRVLDMQIPPLHSCEGDGGRAACSTEVMALLGDGRRRRDQ